MAIISQTIYSDSFSWMKFRILIQISLKFVPKGLIDNTSALDQTMAWYHIGDKPLSEPMLVCCTGEYMRHSTSMSYAWIPLKVYLTPMVLVQSYGIKYHISCVQFWISLILKKIYVGFSQLANFRIPCSITFTTRVGFVLIVLTGQNVDETKGSEIPALQTSRNRNFNRPKRRQKKTPTKKIKH